MNKRQNVYVQEKELQQNNFHKSSVLFWGGLIFLVLFLFWAPFQRALFNSGTSDFETPIYSSLLWTSIVLFFLAIGYYFIYRLKDQKDLFHIFVLLIPCSYLLSLIHAASKYMATNSLYIHILYAVFFLLSVYLTQNEIGNSIIKAIFISSGYVVVLFGLLYWLGNGALGDRLVGWFATMADVNNNKTYLNVVMTDSNGSRLTSVFQYANSYAAYLIALCLIALFYIVKSRKWYTILPHALMVVPMLVSFWLTLSRGALVLLPVTVLVVMLFLSIHRQVMFLIQIGFALVATLIILQKITNIGIDVHQHSIYSQTASGWLVLFLTSLVYTVIATILQMYFSPILEKTFSRFSSRKYITILLPACAIVVVVIGAILLIGDTGFKNILPENVKTRLENINLQQHSVLERGTFYKDAIKLWKDYPWIGAGGGAWAALYEKYQNNPYSSRQDHSFLLQYLNETGLVGLVILLFFLLSVYYFYIRGYLSDSSDRKDANFLYFIFSISILIHSMIDFDLSYVYLGVLLFISLGGMISGTGSYPLRFQVNDKVVKTLYPTFLIVLSFILFILSAQTLSASKLFIKAQEIVKTSRNYNEIAAPLDQAIKKHPNHPGYVLENPLSKIKLLMQLYSQTKDEKYYNEAWDLLSKLKQSEHHNLIAAFQELAMLKSKNHLLEAYDLVNQELVEFPWYIEMHENSIELGTELGDRARQDHDFGKMALYWDHSMQEYNEVLRKKEFLKTLPKGQNQGRNFDVTPQMAYSIGQIYFIKGNYVDAINMLKPFVGTNFDSLVTKMIDIWYLSALQKQGQNDQDLYDKLVSADASNKQQIQELVASNFITK
ncbi:O-antigen ligase family protein [Paenibacillus alba]|uniref:O-antigen ligase family protein n=1 Tax=Paenibacillus alba TaxID=1197127 RepID=A0ABU6G5Z1_9BACL|nr:O-antigen ligase family protein [Paenibacillus alba]MEC0229581.1 O-antigen ligase family protein [Paenibacillus alba]